MLSDSDRRSLAEIERRLCVEEPMLAILGRRLEPALSQRSRALPVRRRRVRGTAVTVGMVAIIGWLGSLPLALLAGGCLAAGALVLRTWA